MQAVSYTNGMDDDVWDSLCRGLHANNQGGASAQRSGCFIDCQELSVAGVVENRVLHRIELSRRVGCVGTRGHVRARTTREHPAHQRRWEIDRSMALQIRTSRFFHAERISHTNGIRTNLRQRFSNCECRSCHNVKMNCQLGNESRIVWNCLELP